MFDYHSSFIKQIEQSTWCFIASNKTNALIMC